MNIEKYLKKGENVNYEGKTSLAIPVVSTALSAIFIIVAIILFINNQIEVGVVFIVLGVPTLIFALTKWEYCLSSSAYITDKRAFVKVGLLRNVFSEVTLDKISGITINQPLFGRIFNYGTVIVESSANVSGARIAYLKNPFEFKKQLEESSENNSDK